MAVITVEQPLLNAMKELATATKKQGISEAKIRMYMEMGIVAVQDAEIPAPAPAPGSAIPTHRNDAKDDEPGERRVNHATSRPRRGARASKKDWMVDMPLDNRDAEYVDDSEHA